MNICIFVGPTLRREEVVAVCDAVCLPPVAQGDVYRIAQQRPRAIGIVDGYFSGVPSVWHKEILWALTQGVRVFGSASMGALRAAELHRYGMCGVGRIFEAFRDGVLEDDDEVAVVHGPAETGFLGASEAMVNIRATLERAEREGVLSASSRHALEISGKSLFFPRRSWAAVLECARAQSIGKGELEKLRAWLPFGRVDRKREDALEMLAAIQEALAQSDPPLPCFHFERTNFWNDFVARSGLPHSAAQHSSVSPHRGILEELRLEGEDAYGWVKDRALLRLLANLEAKRLGLESSLETKRGTLGRMRAALGLLTRADLESWLARNHMDAAALERLIDDVAGAEAITGTSGSFLDQHLLDQLRLTGDYERLEERARRKKDLLEAQGRGEAVRGPLRPNAVALRMWYFERRLGKPVPDDIGAFVRELGFADLNDFDDALRREWLHNSAIND
jgi:hypothetical protein